MPKPTSFHRRAFNVVSAAILVSGCLLTATFLLPVGYAPSPQGLSPVPGQPQDGPPTMAEHDIAPWDGPAFGIRIPAEQFGGKPDSWIYMRIWQALEQSHKELFFPDKSMRLGR